ncbi:unnamed protein product, partial [Meganyctiphanes norvegica]
MPSEHFPVSRSLLPGPVDVTIKTHLSPCSGIKLTTNGVIVYTLRNLMFCIMRSVSIILLWIANISYTMAIQRCNDLTLPGTWIQFCNINSLHQLGKYPEVDSRLCAIIDSARVGEIHNTPSEGTQVQNDPLQFLELFCILALKSRLMHVHWIPWLYPMLLSLSSPSQHFFRKISVYLDPSHPQNTELVTVNCTVLYMSQCMSSNKCKETCKSMGAAAYRWFFDGCCECVGLSCINYGVNESRCIQCPEVGDIEYDEDMTDEFLADRPYDVDDQLNL